ncbi:MAG: PolC-type DNA polymerase III [Spirochaetales bacterium]
MQRDPNATVAETVFTAFDFETTGLFPATDRIVEFGGVRFQDGKILDTFEMLCNPGIPIGADAAKVSGICDGDVAGAIPVAEAIPSFIEFVGESVLVAHNAAFDLGFLRAAAESVGEGEILNPVVDTQALSIKAFPGKKSYGLQNLAVEFGFPPNRAHRALDDAIMCKRLFEHCVEQLSFMGGLELSEVLGAQL